MLTDPNDIRHGTVNGYSNHRCRCIRCQKAGMARALEQRMDRLARGLAEGDPRHGTNNGYTNWGCRCKPCCEGRAARVAAEKQARRPRIYHENDIQPQDSILL